MNREAKPQQLIEAAVAKSRGKVAGPKGAAAKLGIPPATFHLKIKQLNLKKPPSGKASRSTKQNSAIYSSR